ncbi:MAG: hypothetical protein WD492_02155 [Alkalispirochaeta sp.]
MTVFLILSAPLAAAIAYTFIGPRFGGQSSLLSDVPTRRQVLRNPIVAAVPAFIPMYALHTLLGADLFSYSPAGLFFHALLRDYLGWFAVQSTISFLLVRRVKNRPEHDQYMIHLVVATVLLSLLSVAEVVTAGPAMTVEALFLKPLARLSLLALIPAALTVADNAHGGGWAVLALILQPVPAAAVTMLFEWIRPGAAALVLLALFVVTGGVLWAILWREPAHASH